MNPTIKTSSWSSVSLHSQLLKDSARRIGWISKDSMGETLPEFDAINGSRRFAPCTIPKVITRSTQQSIEFWRFGTGCIRIGLAHGVRSTGTPCLMSRLSHQPRGRFERCFFAIPILSPKPPTCQRSPSDSSALNSTSGWGSIYRPQANDRSWRMVAPHALLRTLLAGGCSSAPTQNVGPQASPAAGASHRCRPRLSFGAALRSEGRNLPVLCAPWAWCHPVRGRSQPAGRLRPNCLANPGR